MDYIDAATSGTLSPHILPGNGSTKHVTAHRRNTTIDATSTIFIRRYPTFLKTSTYTCSNSQQTVFTADQYTNSG